MNPLKNVAAQDSKKLLRGATEAHHAMHGGIQQHAADAHERLKARRAELDANMRLHAALGKGGA
jgi:hypothetical protein